ncbi:hypothetical protein E0F88_15100 [Dyadobacter psychrotolerans]|uniref:Carboxypeptidase-like regulatory domain-containing protein n=2 Tax=Dyadobacter psychrotolerans TaxID=2541721 RepID=A0A4R5DL00_9BACT|nr:hypothetical protein E0F88_15100 [Dyadobacter psychrotolerans]
MVGALPLCFAQKLLNQKISITANRQPVSEVLQTISQKGGFYFSYNSTEVPGDSLVTFFAKDQSVKNVLNLLLKGNFQYKETDEYIILQRAAEEKFIYITGRIFDSETGNAVDYASVYSKVYLLSSLTEDDGSFRLKLKERVFPFTLNISKVGYADTSVLIQSERNIDLRINIHPQAIDLDEVLVYNAAGDHTWLARLFVNSRLRAQSKNIGRFFVSLPYQASLTPGLGTHGRMSSQVTNKVSVNLMGGYTAGVNGLELAGWFNISKKNVRYVQLAGVFNVVSGHVEGLQMAGVHNHVLDSLVGVQASGFGNIIAKNLKGIQISGFFNKTSGGFHGVQLAGAANLTGQDSRGLQASAIINRAGGNYNGTQLGGAVNIVKKDISGVQIAGLGNVGRREVSGLQLGSVNYAKNLKGIQIGIVNIADSSSGYSIGIFNFIKNGTGSVSVFTNDIVPFNIAWKTGSHKFYSILMAGSGIGHQEKAYTFGLGFGKEFRLGRALGLVTEISSQNLYLGSWENAPVINRLQTALNLSLSKRLSLSAGPSFSLLHNKQVEAKAGFKQFPPSSYAIFSTGKTTSSWLGWQVGISWNYGSSL